MKRLRIWATVSLTLAIASLAALLVTHAALTDIYHGEKDANLEWTFLRLGFFVIFFLIISTFVCTGLVLKYFRDSNADKMPKTPDRSAPHSTRS